MVGPISPVAAQQPPVRKEISTPPRRFFGLRSLTPCSCFGAPAMTIGRLLPRKGGHSYTVWTSTLTTKMLRIGCWKRKNCWHPCHIEAVLPRKLGSLVHVQIRSQRKHFISIWGVATWNQFQPLIFNMCLAFWALGANNPTTSSSNDQAKHPSLRCSSASSSLWISLMRVEAVLPSFSWSEGQSVPIWNYAKLFSEGV